MSISTASTVAATLNRYRFVAAGGETSLSGVDANGNVLSYTVGVEQVYLNGVLLVRGQDYVATTGSTITSLTALTLNDVVEILTFSTFVITNAVDQTLVDAKGDLLAGIGDNTITRVAVGTSSSASGSLPQIIIADSTASAGISWADDYLELNIMQAI